MNDSNLTGDLLVWFPGLQTGACILYTIIFLVGVIGNILVIIIVSRYRDMRNATNLLLTNLSIADLLLLIFCIPGGYQHLYAKDEYHLGKFMCTSLNEKQHPPLLLSFVFFCISGSFSPFIQNVTSTCSVLTIMAISYERYVAICQPFKVNISKINCLE